MDGVIHSDNDLRVVIRPAVMEDTPILAELSRQLGYPSSEAQIAMRLAHILYKPDHAILVAVLPGERIAGWMHLIINQRLECDAFLEITALVIDYKSRSKGIGKQMVNAAFRWASENNLTEVVVRSNIIRKDAHRFYLHRGFHQVKSQHYFLYT